jgi:hypothetical protein
MFSCDLSCYQSKQMYCIKFFHAEPNVITWSKSYYAVSTFKFYLAGPNVFVWQQMLSRDVIMRYKNSIMRDRMFSFDSKCYQVKQILYMRKTNVTVTYRTTFVYVFILNLKLLCWTKYCHMVAVVTVSIYALKAPQKRFCAIFLCYSTVVSSLNDKPENLPQSSSSHISNILKKCKSTPLLGEKWSHPGKNSYVTVPLTLLC